MGALGGFVEEGWRLSPIKQEFDYFKAEQIARVSAITARHGLNIDNISRLSARPSLNAADNRIARVEFSVRGTPSDLEKLRADFLHIAGEMNVDIAFQEDSIFRRNRRLVVFDMDSTLIEAEVIDERQLRSRRRCGC